LSPLNAAAVAVAPGGVVFDLETVSDRALRSGAARWVGLAVGVVALGFLAQTLAADRARALDWVTSITPGGLAAFIVGFAIFHVGAVATLGPLLRDSQPALSIWSAAQLAKYLPVPGSAVVGMVGTTVRRGGTTRQGLGLIIRHTLLHMGAATAVGSVSVAAAAAGVGVPAPLTATVAVIAGVGVAWLALRPLPAATAAGAIALAVATWALLGGLLAVGFDAGGGAWLTVAGAYPASWVAGQLVVPVPAGIGVRESALLVLLGGALGAVGAATFALGTRLLHVASDGALAGVAHGWQAWRRARGAPAPDPDETA
jgi:hypothetical protein